MMKGTVSSAEPGALYRGTTYKGAQAGTTSVIGLQRRVLQTPADEMQLSRSSVEAPTSILTRKTPIPVQDDPFNSQNTINMLVSNTIVFKTNGLCTQTEPNQYF